jgi:hypothetical protein
MGCCGGDRAPTESNMEKKQQDEKKGAQSATGAVVAPVIGPAEAARNHALWHAYTESVAATTKKIVDSALRYASARLFVCFVFRFFFTRGFVCPFSLLAVENLTEEQKAKHDQLLKESLAKMTKGMNMLLGRVFDSCKCAAAQGAEAGT